MKIEDLDVQISTNWYGHPADLPSRLIVFKRPTDNRYHLIWQTEKCSFCWGTYDVLENELADIITKKIDLQCFNNKPGSCYWDELYFKSSDLRYKLESNLPKFKCYNTIF